MDKIKLVEVRSALENGSTVDDALTRAGLAGETIGPPNGWSDLEQIFVTELLKARAGAAAIIEHAAAAELVGNGGMVSNAEN